MSPALVGIEAELPKIPQEPGAANGVTSSSLTSHDRRGYTQTQESPALDLSDVVGDFEATLKRSTRPSKTSDKQERTENGETFSYFVLSFLKIFLKIIFWKKY